MASSAGIRLKEAILRMVREPELNRLANSAGLPWDFDKGYAPRWLTGNWEYPEAVELVIFLAEPSTPVTAESYSTDPEIWFDQAVRGRLRGEPFGTVNQNRQFQKRLEWFLAECGYDLSDHVSVWSKIVITNAFWLTLNEKFDRHAGDLIESYFNKNILRPMVLEFSNATIVSAGGKAKRRLQAAGVSFTEMGALAPPGCNFPAVRERQVAIAKRIRESRASNRRS